MADVKVLVYASDSVDFYERGDVVEVVPEESDWGAKTVVPQWIRLVITNVPGSSKNAHDNIREYLTDWSGGFTYVSMPGAPEGLQRYRIGLTNTIAPNFDMGNRVRIRDHILSTLGGSLVSQTKQSFDLDIDVDTSINELPAAMGSAIYRRFKFPSELIDQALLSVPNGEPAEFTRSYSWARSNIIDKLRG